MTAPLPRRSLALGSGYAVRLPAFEGPLDLLLHLIEVRELDISSISLMEVTEQYLQTLTQLEEIEPGALADFLVVASRLLYIKSYSLLPKPRPPIEDEDEEASGEALVRQLLEYRRFKEIATHLRSREEQGLRVYVRTAPTPDVPSRLDLSDVDMYRLNEALRKVLRRMPVEPPVPRIKAYQVTVAAQIENVRGYFRDLSSQAQDRRKQPSITFTDLLGRSSTRLEVIVTFLAILELVKLGELDIQQAGTFSEILLVPTDLQSSMLDQN